MRSLARLLAGLLLVLSTIVGTLALTSGPATADCVVPSVADLDTSDVAFAGVVTARRETGDDVITTVRVDRVFKGDATRRVDVVSPAGVDDGTMDVDSGVRLIVFGQLESGEVTSSLCTSVSEPEEYYDPILADLGEGAEPSPGYMRAERRTFGLSYDQFKAGRAILGTMGLVALGFFAFRVWRARRHTRD